MSAIVITHQQPPPKSDNPIVNFVVDLLRSILAKLAGLVSLDFDVRAERTLQAERGVLFVSSPVTAAAPVLLENVAPDVIVKDFTTALICFDSGSGSGRYRYDGQSPLSAATAAAGLPIPAAGFVITITGALNIRSFRVIGEPLQTLNMSIMLHQ